MEVSGRSWDFSPKKTTLARSASDSLSLRSFIYRKGSSPNNMFKCTVHPNFTHKIAFFHVPHVGVSRTRLFSRVPVARAGHHSMDLPKRPPKRGYHGGDSSWSCLDQTMARWWFQLCFIFTPIWGKFTFWLIFFKGVEPPTRWRMVKHKVKRHKSHERCVDFVQWFFIVLICYFGVGRL